MFWKYVQSKTKVKQSVTSINRPDGTTTVDDLEIASVLNNFWGLFSLMKICQICHLWMQGIMGNLCYQWTFLTRMSGVNCVG